MRQSVIQCLFFVVHGKTTHSFVLIPSAAVEEHSNVCQLFARNNVKILENCVEYPTLYEALKRDGVEVLELIVFSSTHEKAFSCASETTPFIPVSVRPCNQELVRQLLGKDAAVIGSRDINYDADFKAIDDGNSNVIERLLTFRPDIKYKNPDGGTILHLAVRLQNETLVQLLLNQCVSVDAVDNNGLTPLHLAASIKDIINDGNNGEDNRWIIANQLLEHGAPVNAKTKYGSTSLLLAMKNQSYHMVRLLLRNNADANIPDHNGLTPLHLGAKRGDLEIVDEFLRHSANVNAIATFRHSEAVTPLWVAVDGGSLAVVKWLLAKGADPIIPCYDNQTILQLAVDLERVSIIECILKHHPNLSNKTAKNVICKAVFHDDGAYNRISQLLTAHGFSLGAEERNDAKLLHDALYRDDEATVRQLLEAGANVNKVYFYRSENCCALRKTLPLDTAIARDMTQVVKLLISHGADLHAKLDLDDGECPALLCALSIGEVEIPLALIAEHNKIPPAVGYELVGRAIEWNSPELLKEVLKKCTGAYREMETDEFPFLLSAVSKGYRQIVEILLKCGDSIDVRDSYWGDTVLHCVGRSSDNLREMVRYLVQNIADVEARNFAGKTPLSNAIIRNGLDVVVELLKYGACIDAVDDSGGTPISHAVCLRSQPIFQALLEFYFTDIALVQRSEIYRFFNLVYVESLHDASGWLECLYDVFKEDRESLEGYAEVLARHLIRLKAAFPEREIFDFCSKKNLQSLSRGEYLMPADRTEEEWLAFRGQCETEVVQLKSRNVGDSCASFYDVLTKSLDEVASYLQNPVIFQAMETKSYAAEFPVYAEVLSYQFEKGSLRSELLNEGTKQCHLLVSLFRDLPVHLKEQVLRFLTNRELEVAVHACKCVASRQSD